MRIRAQQMQSLQEGMEDSLKRRLLKRFATAYAETAGRYGDAELQRLVDAGVTRALGYGLRDELNIERFLGYFAHYGDAFGVDGETEWVGALLGDDRLTSTEKMNELDRRWHAQ